MKRKFLVAVVVAVMSLSLIFAVACAGEFNELEVLDKNLGNHENLDVVEGMSAYDLVMEAYENWCNDTNYVREEYFSFAANDGALATRDTHMIRKIKGDEIYSQEIIYGTGQDKGSCAKKYYFDGTNAYYTNNTNKKDLTMDETTKELSTASWGEFAPFAGDIAEENRVLTEHMTTYDLSKREYLAQEHDDKVYTADGVYYCTLTIDCAAETMKTTHRAALDEFLANTGAEENGFTCNNTTIDFAIRNVDGKNKIVIWKRNEVYSGNYMLGPLPIKVSCQQTCLAYFTYGNAEITSNDLAGLNK